MNWRAIPLALILYLNGHFAWAADQHYEIVVLHCLQLNPTNCGSTTLPLASLPANPSAAYAQAQAMVAKWIEEHPGLTLRGFDMKIGRGA